MTVDDLLGHFGEEITEADEEVFELFSLHAGSKNLGMLDGKAPSIDITIAGHDFSIRQSPTILTSSRKGGTTGAVVWAVTPLFATWLTSSSNILFRHGLLNEQSIVLELGCGIAGIVGLMLSPKVGRYILTDQDYVMKLLRHNINDNARLTCQQQPQHGGKSKRPHAQSITRLPETMVLDWETSSLRELSQILNDGNKQGRHDFQGLDCVIACDCIFNEALVEPFVKTCATLCQLRQSPSPTICVIAQQLRSPEVFEYLLTTMAKYFRLWRVPEEAKAQTARQEGLSTTAGFVIHLAVRRE